MRSAYAQAVILLDFFPKASPSSNVSGRGVPNVSGKNNTKAAPINGTTPKIIGGNQ